MGSKRNIEIEDELNNESKAEKGEENNSEKETAAPEQGQAGESESKPGDGQDKINELNDKYLRLYSEFDNFRKRTMRERVELIQQSNKDLLLEILPVVDDFERAIEVMVKNEESETAIEGFRLIYNKLKGVTNTAGLKEIDAKGQPFDPEIHEALTKIPAPAPDMKGKVIDVVQKGYMLNDKVARFAKVVVGE